MFYIITDNGIKAAKTLTQLNQKINANMQETEFQKVGSDSVVYLQKSDLAFVQDKKTMSKIPIQRLYKKSDSNSLVLYGILALQVILLIKG